MNQSHRKHSLHLSVKVVTFLTYLGTYGSHLIHRVGNHYILMVLDIRRLFLRRHTFQYLFGLLGLNFNFSTVTLSISLKLKVLAVAYNLAD